MIEKLSKCNATSIFIELIGIIIMTIGITFEYIYARDLYLLYITVGSLIMSVGSAVVNKFPWAHVGGKIGRGNEEKKEE